MREIKFRGLDLLTGEWVYGSHLKTGEGIEYIVPQDIISIHLPRYAVEKDTVGQYTGVNDSVGNEVYEGDVFHLGDPNIKYVVVWSDSGLHGLQLGTCGSVVGLEHWRDRIKLLGNKFENPYLVSETR